MSTVEPVGSSRAATLLPHPSPSLLPDLGLPPGISTRGHIAEASSRTPQEELKLPLLWMLKPFWEDSGIWNFNSCHLTDTSGRMTLFFSHIPIEHLLYTQRRCGVVAGPEEASCPFRRMFNEAQFTWMCIGCRFKCWGYSSVRTERSPRRVTAVMSTASLTPAILCLLPTSPSPCRLSCL